MDGQLQNSPNGAGSRITSRPKSSPCAKNQRNVARFASVHLGDSSRISRSASSQS